MKRNGRVPRSVCMFRRASRVPRDETWNKQQRPVCRLLIGSCLDHTTSTGSEQVMIEGNRPSVIIEHPFCAPTLRKYRLRHKHTANDNTETVIPLLWQQYNWHGLTSKNKHTGIWQWSYKVNLHGFQTCSAQFSRARLEQTEQNSSDSFLSWTWRHTPAGTWGDRDV